MKANLIHVPLLPDIIVQTNALWVLTGLVILLLFYSMISVFRERKAIKALMTEQELKTLRAQLDPHMLQNTFEILTSRILHQSHDSTVSFIRQVSSYFGQVLQVSDKTILTLEEELAFTEEYLSLQKKISGDIFDYNITIDENIDTYGVDVPSMLFQPIIENSVKHGFTGCQGKKGRITITLEQNDLEIICILSDNGSGLPEKSSMRKPSSKGLALTRRRLELLYHEYRHRPHMEMISNAATGVTTIIKIPLI